MNNLNPWTIQCRSVAAPHISSNGKLQKVLGTILSKAKKNCPPSTPWHDLLLDDPDQEVPIKRRRQTNFDLRYERLSKLLVHGQTMDDLGGSYRFTRIPSHVSVRYRFALVKVRRPSDSLILLVACPALYCPLLPFTALYCLLLSFTCPLMLFTAFYCPLRPFTALYCPLLPFTAWGSGS